MCPVHGFLKLSVRIRVATMNAIIRNMLFLMICLANACSFISCETTANKNDNIVVTLVHPDSSLNGKKVILDIDFYTPDISVHEPPTSYIFEGTFQGNKAVIATNLPVVNNIDKNSFRMNLRTYAYLIGESEDEDIDDHTYNNTPTVFAVPFAKNIEQYGNIQNMVTQLFPINKNGKKSFIIEFPKRLNIQEDYNFLDYPLKINWTAYPGNVLSYNLAILKKDTTGNTIIGTKQIGNTGWLRVYDCLNIKNTTVGVPAEYFSFKERNATFSENEIQNETIIAHGDILKIEVLVSVFTEFTDRSSYYKKYMDSITVMYKEQGRSIK